MFNEQEFLEEVLTNDRENNITNTYAIISLSGISSIM